MLEIEPQRAPRSRASCATRALGRGRLRNRHELEIGSPDQGEWRAMRCRPESTTVETPSIVSDVSATLVARIIRRWAEGRTARSCTSGGRSPSSGRPRRCLVRRAGRGPVRSEYRPRRGGTRARGPRALREGHARTRSRPALERARVSLLRELDRHLVSAAGHADDLGAQELGDAIRVEGGAHRDQRELGALLRAA